MGAALFLSVRRLGKEDSGVGACEKSGLRLVGFEQGDRRLKAGFTFAATKLDDVSVHTHFRDMQEFLMMGGTGSQPRAGAFLGQLRIPDDASNGSNSQAVARFAIHAQNADRVGDGEHFKIQRQGMDGKTLL